MPSTLTDFFESQPDICVAFLFGSRARGAANAADWDIAVCFDGAPQMSHLEQLARLEQLRSALAKALGCGAVMIDLRRAPLNLCITVAEEGKVLKGGETLELFRFYQRAWRGQEEFHFRKAHGL